MFLFTFKERWMFAFLALAVLIAYYHVYLAAISQPFIKTLF